MSRPPHRAGAILAAATLSLSLCLPALAGRITGNIEVEIIAVNTPDGTGSVLPYSVSNDGRLVALRADFGSLGSLYPGYWTSETGVQPLDAGDLANVVGATVSADGSTIVGTINRSGGARAFRWQGPGTFQTFGPPAGVGLSTADAVTADGSRFAGSAVFETGFEGYLSSSDGKFMSLGPSRVGGMSADASMVAGSEFLPEGSRAWYWTPEEGRRIIPNLGTSANASVTGVSADGSTIFGRWDMLPSRGNEPEKSGFAWSPGSGVRNLSNFDSSPFRPSLVASNADGSVIVGMAWDGGFGGSAVWLEGSSVPLNGVEYIESLGYHFPDGMVAIRISDISDDGLTFVGSGVYEGENIGWIARVPSPAGSCVLLFGLVALRRRRTR
ncbi:MAG: hypothetical protein ACF8MJ_08320 [Phycisphaerales bacterium JB050]